jgi:DNA-binding protein H-NS
MKTVKSLREQIAKLEAEIIEVEQKAKADLLEKFRAMAGQSGLSLDDVLGKSAKRNGKPKPAVQYRHKTGETWTGRGRRPTWCRDMSKSQLEAFRVSA